MPNRAPDVFGRDRPAGSPPPAAAVPHPGGCQPGAALSPAVPADAGRGTDGAGSRRASSMRGVPSPGWCQPGRRRRGPSRWARTGPASSLAKVAKGPTARSAASVTSAGRGRARVPQGVRHGAGQILDEAARRGQEAGDGFPGHDRVVGGQELRGASCSSLGNGVKVGRDGEVGGGGAGGHRHRRGRARGRRRR